MTYSQIVDAGRELGIKIIKTAIEGSRNNQQMSDQICVCRHAAIQIMTCELYNFVEQKKGTQDEFLAELIEDIKYELESAKEVELVTHQAKPVVVIGKAIDS